MKFRDFFGLQPYEGDDLNLDTELFFTGTHCVLLACIFCE